MDLTAVLLRARPAPTPTPPSLFVTGLVGGDADLYGAGNLATLQAAADAAERSHGGRVTLPPGGPYRIAGTLTLGSRVVLDLNCQTLKLANKIGTTTAPKSVVAAKAGTNYVGVVNGYIDGNKANQADTGFRSHGVDYTRVGTENSGGPTYDGGLYVDRIMVADCAGFGLAATGPATTLSAANSAFYHNDGGGVAAKSDCELSGLVVGNNGGPGFEIYAATSARLTSLKGFGNGRRASYPDFWVHYSESVHLANCESEDFGQVGFLFTAVEYVTAVGVSAFRCNGHNADSYSSAFWVEDDGAGNQPSHLTIIGGAKCDGGPATANYALTTRNLGAQCDIRLHADGWATAAHHKLSGDGNGLFDAHIQVGGG